MKIDKEKEVVTKVHKKKDSRIHKEPNKKTLKIKGLFFDVFSNNLLYFSPFLLFFL